MCDQCVGGEETFDGVYLGNMYSLSDTDCCGFDLLGAENTTPHAAINHAQRDAGKNSESDNRSLLCVTIPGEGKLEKTLQAAGFTCLADDIPRRQGMGRGLMKLWLWRRTDPIVEPKETKTPKKQAGSKRR